MTVHDAMSHEEAIELLPWLVNGSLDASEREAVRGHASSCVICRRELAELDALQQSISNLSAQIETPGVDMRRINARIDAQLERESKPRERLAAMRSFFAKPWRTAFAVQTALLLAIAVVWLRPDDPAPEFRTLTAPEVLPAGDYVRVVFDPTLDDSEMPALLHEHGLVVIDGPSERGVVTLRFVADVHDDEHDAIIERMRDDPRILFAQPVTGGN